MLPHLGSYRTLSGAMALALLSACSVAPEGGTGVHDPYESANRATHALNTGLDRAVLRPASQAYGQITPEPVRTSLDNASANLGLPAAAANKLLQGDLEGTVHNVARFVLNSTVGLFGLFDPATEIGLFEQEAGFADTLAVWGADEGAYVVLPFFGPSTERDSAGLLVDLVTNPVESLLGSDAGDAVLPLFAAETLNSRYEFTNSVDSILYESADSYAQLRLFYLDSRRFELGQTAKEDEDPLEDLYDGLFDE